MRSPVATLSRSFRNAAAQPPVALTDGRSRGSGLSIFGSGNNTADLLAATKGSGTVYSIVRRISNAVAQSEWKLYHVPTTQQGGYGDDSNRIEVLNHAALDVLRKPNPFMSWHRICEASGQHGEVIGESWIVFGNDGQRAPGKPGVLIPSSMWYVRPDRIQPVTSPTDYIIGYIYTAPGGEKVPLQTWQVMPIIVPDPEAQFRGLGWVRSILSTIDAEKYSAEWNRMFFINNAEPGGILQVGDLTSRVPLSDAEFDEVQQRWRETHRGIGNAHRVAVLEGMTYIPNSETHHDMQFVELRTASRDACLEAAGLPGSMIGISEHVNKANAQTGEVTFARWITRERLDRWKDALNLNYLPLFGSTAVGLEFDYVDPTPTDDSAETAATLTRSQAAQILVTAGWDATEVLATVGLPEMDWKAPAQPPAPIHVLPGAPGGNPALPEGQPNENDDAKELANA